MSDTIGLHGHIYTGNASAAAGTASAAGTVKRKSTRAVFLKILIFILLFLLICETIFYLFIIPAISVAKIQFTETANIPLGVLKKAAGLTGAERWGQLDTHIISRKLASYPLIAQVKVIKKFPDKLIIEVTERTAAAVLFASAGNRTVPMEIDKTGMVFRVGADISSKTLPIVSGLEFSNPRAGMKVHKQLVPLFKQLDILQKKNPVLLSEISEMRIEQKKYGGFDLIIYPVQTKIKVRTDSTLNEDGLRYMMLMLDVVAKLGFDSQIEELDVRAGTAAYRLRGDRNE
ncbi:MAG: cell division protein FtsQ/DivIB [Treponema sp.]